VNYVALEILPGYVILDLRHVLNEIFALRANLRCLKFRKIEDFILFRYIIEIFRHNFFHFRSTATRLLRLWVRIPPGAWTFVCCECCVLSGRGLCDELITCPEKSYRLWRLVVCDLETSKEEAKARLKGCEYKPTMGCDAEREKQIL
jgi:hypothetical protein